MQDKKTMTIYCCGCLKDVQPRLTNGAEIHPHRRDLHHLPFWKCDACNNYVGCHHKTRTPTKPLGNIPTREIMRARGHIHALLDPIWKSGMARRGKVYTLIAQKIGKGYHTGEIKTLDEAREIYRVIREIKSQLSQGECHAGH